MAPKGLTRPKAVKIEAHFFIQVVFDSPPAIIIIMAGGEHAFSGC